MDLNELRRRHKANKSKRPPVAILTSASITRARKNARKSRVMDLLDKGMSKKEVIEITGLTRTTINSYLRS